MVRLVFFSVLYANHKDGVLFEGLKVLNVLSLSWVAGQFENATAKIAEGDKNTAPRVQDSCGVRSISEGETAGYLRFPEIGTHLNVFQCSPHLLFRSISVLMN